MIIRNLVAIYDVFLYHLLMTYLARALRFDCDIKRKSVFLFGPRQTGKTSYLKKNFPNSPFYNLLLADTFASISQRPQLIREEVLARKENLSLPIIIDEIQKLPVLLDEVHSLIEEKGCHFILTGSSARKLKRSGVNLLGGRARTKHLYPFASVEIPDYDLLRILNIGSIPSIYLSDEPEKDLADYVGTYLQEEISAEGLTRKIENFSRFLQTASLVNAELLNFTNVGNDAGVSPRTVAEYFEILKDTMVGSLLSPFTKTQKRKAISTAKFYFFDLGICNHLAGRKNIQPKTELFGKVFEHFIFTELNAYLSYSDDSRSLSFWRSTSGYEVDFLLADEIAIEVKGTEMVSERHAKGLRALSDDIRLKRKIIVSNDPRPRKMGDIDVLPVRLFLEQLWNGEI